MFRVDSENSFVRSYALASLAVIIVLMLCIGWWVSSSIEKQVIENTATNVALYVQSFITPELQGMAERDYLTELEMQHIESLLAETPLGKKILSVKVWKEGGKVVYYSRRALIGQRFEPTENLKRAWQGEVTAEFDDLAQNEDQEEARLEVPLLEIYSPVRQHGRDNIIAVAEFYQDAGQLAAHLQQTRNRSWVVVIASMLTAYGILYGIVRLGGGVIRQQQGALQSQVRQLTDLLEQNESLGRQLRKAFRNSTENNENLLRRVSADLHDGPAQYMGLALLRLDTLSDGLDEEAKAKIRPNVDELRRSLDDSLTELRLISRGLAFPDLEQMPLEKVIQTAIQSHIQRTHSEVATDLQLQGAGVRPGTLVKITAFRTVQESLTNAFRHAQGAGQRVCAEYVQDQLILSISDEGDGFDVSGLSRYSTGLGLPGLRERLKAIGGTFRIESRPGEGTTLVAKIPLQVSD